MPKLTFKRGAPVQGVSITIQGDEHLLRFGALALSSLEEQLDQTAPEALAAVSRGLAAGKINARLILALLAAGLAHEAIEQDCDLPEWRDLAPSFETTEGRRELVALVPSIAEAIRLAYPPPKLEDKQPDPNPQPEAVSA